MFKKNLIFLSSNLFGQNRKTQRLPMCNSLYYSNKLLQHQIWGTKNLGFLRKSTKHQIITQLFPKTWKSKPKHHFCGLSSPNPKPQTRPLIWNCTNKRKMGRGQEKRLTKAWIRCYMSVTGNGFIHHRKRRSSLLGKEERREWRGTARAGRKW